MIANLRQRVLHSPVLLLAFGFGSGLAPKAPGTIGTLAAIPLYLLLAKLPLIGYVLVVLLSFMVGCWLCGEAAKQLGVHDFGGIVWDEFVGYWITMFAAPAGWLWIALAFVLFRLFDIWKPWPIRTADKQVQGGLGIMLDDVLAGLYAWLCLQALAYFVL
jgi:phosphatidylglycerophosphatase A